jgi:serine protease Do
MKRLLLLFFFLAGCASSKPPVAATAPHAEAAACEEVRDPSVEEAFALAERRGSLAARVLALRAAKKPTADVEAYAVELGKRVEALAEPAEKLSTCDAKKKECQPVRAALVLAAGVLEDPAMKNRAAVIKAFESLIVPKDLAATRDAFLDAWKKLVLTAKKDDFALEPTPRTEKKCAAPSGDEWVAAAKPDMRKLTVVVRVKPPGTLPADFERWANEADEQTEANLYRASARGASGSGFVLVRQEPSGKQTYVVTNRHVVETADRPEIWTEDGTRIPATIAYVDARYDLAVLLPKSPLPVDSGIAVQTETVKDQEAIIATGFPVLGSAPSYQTTRGYVSNERFWREEEGTKLLHFQHTAPIDPGSSGGPVTTSAGLLVGVNTFKAFGRENVAFAVPARAVVDAVRTASTLEERLKSESWRKDSLRDACLALVTELQTKSPDVGRFERMLSPSFVARDGVDSYEKMSASDARLKALFVSDPVDGLRYSILRRMQEDAILSPGEVCARPNQADWASIMTVDRVRFTLGTASGTTREVAFRWDHGQWLVSRWSFKNG